MAISAKQVQELRAKTGAGIMDCKKALNEAGGNLDGALEAWLGGGGGVFARLGEFLGELKCPNIILLLHYKRIVIIIVWN